MAVGCVSCCSAAGRAARSWYTEDTFRAILRLRGIESGAPQGFAEAYTARKLVLDPGRTGG